MSMIGIKNLRLDSTQYTVSEQYNSVYAILILIICVGLNLLIPILYWYKIKSAK